MLIRARLFLSLRKRNVLLWFEPKTPIHVSDILDQLSEVQREAARNYQGPSIIIAGAGSGKTRVLTYRIAYMLEQGVAPYNILALTFTNKAAREMKERIGSIVSEGRARSLWMGTFHSVFARILRNEAEKLGYPSSFTIYDTADSRNVVRSIIKDLNLNDETYKPAQVASRISLAKNNLVTAASYESNTILVAEDRERRQPQFAEIYKMYTRRCKENGAMDFDDLLLNTNILFRDFPQVLESYQNRFLYLLVDEYQDTNMAQYLIIKKIAEKFRNLCVVGDDAQSIYSFRGAKIENILRFRKDYPEARMYKLEQNYRSTQTIVNAANCVIGQNKNQIPKKSFSANSEGDKICVYKAYTDQEEAIIVSRDLYASARHSGAQYSDFAVLYRTNAQSRVIEESFRRQNIPYRIYGGQSFYQRKEIKDVLAYIRLVVNPRDDEALRRIINYPARGIGDVTVSRIAAAAQANGVSMWEAIKRLSPAQMELRGGAAKKIADFVAMIEELAMDVYTTPAYEVGLKAATRSGIVGSFKMQQTPESVSVLENIDELLNSIASYTEMRIAEEPELGMVRIDEWLQNVSLMTDMDQDKDDSRNHVTLMTVHSAKGLEFDHVYIVGLEETLFPSQMSETPEALEEERRLFYVALTRARNRAVLTFSATRYRWGNITSNRPSRFIREIDPDFLDPRYDEDPSENGFAIDAPRDFSGQREGDRPKNAYRKKDPAGGSVPGSQYDREALAARLRSIGKRRETEAETPARPVAPTGPTDVGELKVGKAVEHDKFGRGTIVSLEETGHGPKATVRFDVAGSKTLLLKYAKLRLLD